MDYRKHYDSLITKARAQKYERFKTNYHHVIPKCLGGEDDKVNRVHLTHKQHFLAHLLLWKTYPDNDDLARSVTIAGRKGGKRIRSRLYAELMEVAKRNPILREVGRRTIGQAREAFWNNPEAVEKHRLRMSEHGKKIGKTIGTANLKTFTRNNPQANTINGKKGAAVLNRIRAKCAICGLESNLPGVHTHQRYNNHIGVVRL